MAGLAHRCLPAPPSEHRGSPVDHATGRRLRTGGGRRRPSRRSGPLAGSRRAPAAAIAVCSGVQPRSAPPSRPGPLAGGSAATAIANAQRSLVADLVRPCRRRRGRTRGSARNTPGIAADRGSGGARRPGRGDDYSVAMGRGAGIRVGWCSHSTWSATTGGASGWSIQKAAATSARSAHGGSGCSKR